MTFTTRKSLLQKVSKSTFSVSCGSTSIGGSAALRGLFLELLELGELLVHVDAREERVALVDGDVLRAGRPTRRRRPRCAARRARLSGRRPWRVLSGMKGVSSWVQIRSASSRLYITVARRALFASSFASTQGAVSSIYLFAREMTLKTSSSAVWVWKVSISFSYLPRSSPAIVLSSQSISSACRSAGSVPSKYFTTIATVRLSRLP